MRHRTAIDEWRGLKRYWVDENGQWVLVQIDETRVQLNKYQAATIEMITKGESGPLYDDAGLVAKVAANKKGRAILEIDPGLGKSRIGIEVYKYLCPDRQKVLVVCSKKALNTWRREFPKWCKDIKEEDVQLVTGDPIDRKLKWQDQTKTVYVVTYQSGMNDDEHWSKLGFDFVICDECKILVNRKTKTYKYWSKYLTPNRLKYCIMMDGTLIRSGPQDLWSTLHILDHQHFSSYWKFVNMFCYVHDGYFGKEIVGPKNTKALGEILRYRFVKLRDKDPEVQGQRPPLTRDLIQLDLPPEVRTLHDQLLLDLIAITPNNTVIASPSQMGIVMKLRQLLVCPYIFDPTLGPGLMIEHLVETMRDNEDPHVVIFTPFKKAIPIFSGYLQEQGFEYPYILQGGSSPDDVRRVEEEFNSPKGKSKACLCTIKFAESFELPTAKSCYFIGFEWAQRENYQAEKRLQRLTTPHPINSWYYSFRDTTDDDIIHRLNYKQHGINITFQDYMNILRSRLLPQK